MSQEKGVFISHPGLAGSQGQPAWGPRGSAPPGQQASPPPALRGGRAIERHEAAAASLGPALPHSVTTVNRQAAKRPGNGISSRQMWFRSM